MAFGADCGASTVLEESRVARTVGSLVPGVCRVKNSKFEIRNSKSVPAFRIPNSNTMHRRLQQEAGEICGLVKPTTHVPWDSVCRRLEKGWRSGRRS